MENQFLLTALLGLALLNAGHAANDLDGTQWKSKAQGPSGLMFWKSDTLTFEKSNFSSKDTLKKGADASPYETTAEGGNITWTATQKGAHGEHIQWQGTRVGDEMTGAVTVTEPGKEPKTRHWKAVRNGDK